MVAGKASVSLGDDNASRGSRKEEVRSTILWAGPGPSEPALSARRENKQGGECSRRLAESEKIETEDRVASESHGVRWGPGW